MRYYISYPVMNVLFIYPPVAKPSEPPAGLARLAGFLTNNGIGVTTIDASLHGLLYLLNAEISSDDTWTSRASGRLNKNLAALRAKNKVDAKIFKIYCLIAYL